MTLQGKLKESYCFFINVFQDFQYYLNVEVLRCENNASSQRKNCSKLHRKPELKWLKLNIDRKRMSSSGPHIIVKEIKLNKSNRVRDVKRQARSFQVPGYSTA